MSFVYQRNQILDMVDYVLIAWRSGQMGAAAIGDSLLGHAEPTGRLAQGWPRNVGQVNTCILYGCLVPTAQYPTVVVLH